MNAMRSLTSLLFAVGTSLAAFPSAWAQTSGVFVLDGWPEERMGPFAGRTEILVDGDRLRITEWPEDSEDPARTLATYYTGASVVKEFAWNGERVALLLNVPVEERPFCPVGSDGTLRPPAPYPALGQEGTIPCGEGCFYHVRTASFSPLAASAFAPGGSHANAFAPPRDVPLLTPDEFQATYGLNPDGWWFDERP
jgi:hypothetical protein